MNISPVSFRAISTDPNRKLIDEVITKPQAFMTQDNPVASTSVSEKPKKGKLGKVLVALAGVAGAAALCAYGVKSGKLAQTEGGNKILNGVKKALSTVGETVVKLFSKKEVVKAAEEVVEGAV